MWGGLRLLSSWCQHLVRQIMIWIYVFVVKSTKKILSLIHKTMCHDVRQGWKIIWTQDQQKKSVSDGNSCCDLPLVTSTGGTWILHSRSSCTSVWQLEITHWTPGDERVEGPRLWTPSHGALSRPQRSKWRFPLFLFSFVSFWWLLCRFVTKSHHTTNPSEKLKTHTTQ